MLGSSQNNILKASLEDSKQNEKKVQFVDLLTGHEAYFNNFYFFSCTVEWRKLQLQNDTDVCLSSDKTTEKEERQRAEDFWSIFGGRTAPNVLSSVMKHSMSC